MKPHVKTYLKYFDIGEQDFIFCEYHFIKYGSMVRSNDIHHIVYRAQGGSDEIINTIALDREIHNKVHNEEIKKSELTEIHNRFLIENPY